MVLVGSLLLLFLLAWLGVLRAGAGDIWAEKVDTTLLQASAQGEQTEFLVILEAQADLSQAARRSSKEAKGAAVYAQLTAVAQRTQAPLVAALEAAGADYRPYWVNNMIWVRGDGRLIEQLARRDDVARLEANPWVQLDRPAGGLNAPAAAEEEAGVEWNIALVNAPAVWAAGATGQGVVIGGQDTGYDWQHPALKAHYRGWNGAVADHAYNWHDAIHEDIGAGNPCGINITEPCDDNGHGTHTMGTMVGDDGGGNQVGMAPGARWIGCRNMEEGAGTPATYAECYEWFIAPYPPGGDPFTDGRPDKAPHVINNSWSCPPSEGCKDPDVLRQVVNNVRAAGIVTVHSAGNSANSLFYCSTVDSPGAIYDASFTVAATDNSDQIAEFSSRGPVLVGDNSPAKPDISAPGVSIRSSYPGNSYVEMGGTSMAAPHVAGLVALLISAQPELAGDVERIESLIMQTAVERFTTEGCGGDTATSLPNHTYGWGRIDAYASFLALDDPDPEPTATNTPDPTGEVETPTPTPTGTPQPQFDFLSYVPVWLRP
jgi:subtilisin family serine protease